MIAIPASFLPILTIVGGALMTLGLVIILAIRHGKVHTLGWWIVLVATLCLILVVASTPPT